MMLVVIPVVIPVVSARTVAVVGTSASASDGGGAVVAAVAARSAVGTTSFAARLFLVLDFQTAPPRDSATVWSPRSMGWSQGRFDNRHPRAVHRTQRVVELIPF